MTRTDPLTAVAAYRPTDETIDHAWEQERRTALLDRIIIEPARADARDATATHRAARRRRRLIPVAALLAATSVAAVVLGLVLPGGTPGSAPVAQARTLEQLATNAEHSRAYVIERGQFLYLANRAAGGTTEIWTAADGTVWTKSTSADGVLSYMKFGPGGDRLNNPSPKYLTTLPRDPAKLEKYMRAHVSGSTSVDEAVFVAAGDMLRTGLVPPDLRAALIRVLARTPHVSVHTTQDDVGRPALAVTFDDQQQRPGQTQTLMFDPATAAFLEEAYGRPGSTEHSGAVYTWKIVDSVPADVLQHSQLQQDTAELPQGD